MEIKIFIDEEERIEICEYLDSRLRYFEEKGENFLMDNREEYIILGNILNKFRDEENGEYDK